MNLPEFVQASRLLNKVCAIHYSFIGCLVLSGICLWKGKEFGVDPKWIMAAWFGILQLVLGYVMGSKSKVEKYGEQKQTKS